jgi:hypothetical protein
MSSTYNQRVLAPLEREELIREIFPIHMAPEEYAARFGHQLNELTFCNYRYNDPVVNAWMQRLERVFFSPDLLKSYQEQFLTHDERMQIPQEV